MRAHCTVLHRRAVSQRVAVMRCNRSAPRVPEATASAGCDNMLGGMRRRMGPSAHPCALNRSLQASSTFRTHVLLRFGSTGDCKSGSGPGPGPGPGRVLADESGGWATMWGERRNCDAILKMFGMLNKNAAGDRRLQASTPKPDCVVLSRHRWHGGHVLLWHEESLRATHYVACATGADVLGDAAQPRDQGTRRENHEVPNMGRPQRSVRPNPFCPQHPNRGMRCLCTSS